MTNARSHVLSIDPNTIRRRGVGLRGYDRERASAGYTLFAPNRFPNTGGGTVYLIDIEGNVVHKWNLPHPPGLYGYLTERGTLLYNGQIRNDSWLGNSAFMGGVLMEVDWAGQVVWVIRHREHHHDGILLKNGNVLLLCSTPLPDEVARRVLGGRAGSEQPDGRINADYLLEMSTDGRSIWEWRTWEHMAPEDYPITSPSDDRTEWTHGNGVAELPSGDLLLSMRNISTVVRIDRGSNQVCWRMGAPFFSGQHAPAPLPDGNILLYDNGPFRVDTGRPPFSAVLEIDPASNTIVWKYQDPVPHAFFSSRISNAQRLPNGNTLINEGQFGRFFEVTLNGDTVWEYVNPHFGPTDKPPKEQTNGVFRALRYTAGQIAAWSRAG
jgi:hypothetical protein